MTAKQAKIAIYGAGAMGTVLGAFLTKGGLQPDLITRNSSHVEQLKTQGATVVCAADGRTYKVKVNALLPSELSRKYDVIFLMTKQRYNREILTTLLPFLSENGVVVTTQNGLPERSVAEVVGKERTYGAVASFGANFTAAGCVTLTSKLDAMRITLGGYAQDDKLPLLKEILSYAATQTNENFVQTTENLLGARWEKLAVNAAFSGLSVVTGLTFGEVARKRKTRKIALGVFRECVAVATAQGVTIPKSHGFDMQKIFGENTPLKNVVAYLVLPFAMRKHKKLTSGMLKDVQNGRKCEIDFIDGIVAEEDKRLGVAAPLCRRITELVHGIENGLYETSYANTDFFFGESAND